MENDSYIVIEGVHKNPNNIDTLDEKTKIIHGPYDKKKAEEVAKGLIQKNVDNFYHRAWVLKKNIELNDICEDCKREDKSVKQNLMLFLNSGLGISFRVYVFGLIY